MEKTKKAFRLVIKREVRRQRELFEERKSLIFITWWRRTGQRKKRIRGGLVGTIRGGRRRTLTRKLKNWLGMERMPCGQSWANAVFFRIGVIAYNLFIGFKRLACPESWAKQTIATFRWKMVQVAGRIVKHAGELVLKLMVDMETLELFRGIRKKSFELSLCPEGKTEDEYSGQEKSPRERFAKNLRNRHAPRGLFLFLRWGGIGRQFEEPRTPRLKKKFL